VSPGRRVDLRRAAHLIFMSEIPKAYEPQAVEDKWYQFWLDEKCFVADANSSKPA
jgi:hypothetical protein